MGPEVAVWGVLVDPVSFFVSIYIYIYIPTFIYVYEGMVTDLFIYASKSFLPNGSINLSILDPFQGGTTVPTHIYETYQHILSYIHMYIYTEREGIEKLTIIQPIHRPRRRSRIKLPPQITILGIRPITKIRPQPMQSPAVTRQDLALRFESRVRVPELGADEQSAKGFGAAGVDLGGVGLGGAGEDRGFWGNCQFGLIDFFLCIYLWRIDRWKIFLLTQNTGMVQVAFSVE